MLVVFIDLRAMWMSHYSRSRMVFFLGELLFLLLFYPKVDGLLLTNLIRHGSNFERKFKPNMTSIFINLKKIALSDTHSNPTR